MNEEEGCFHSMYPILYTFIFGSYRERCALRNKANGNLGAKLNVNVKEGANAN